MSPTPAPVRIPSLTPKGMDFTRIAIALALGKGKDDASRNIAVHRWGENSLAAKALGVGAGQIFELIQKTVAGSRISGNWAAEIASTQSAAAEFFALVRQRSIIGRIEGLRRVPLVTRLVGAATGFAAAWVGEGQPVPLSTATYDESTLAPRKLSALCVVTNELLENADPAGELLIRNDLVAACVDALNATFLDPSNSGTANVKPASITNGITAAASTGDGLTDIRNMIDMFPGDIERAVLVGSPSTFAALHDPLMMPGLGVRGGEAIGIPAIPAPAAGDTLILVDPDGIAIGEAEMALKVSTQGTIQMSDTPTQNTTTPTAVNQTSLWQNNSTAIMAEKVINWAVVRPSVAVVTAIATS